MNLVGEDGKEIQWEGPTTFVPGKKYFFILGHSQSLGNS